MRTKITGTCLSCGSSALHAHKLCYKCYKKIYRQPKVVCKNCGREREHKAFGLCGSCHIKLKHYDKVKRYNAKRYHNLSLELYEVLTSFPCILCGFDKAVDLHHVDGSHKNNSPFNLVALCPNHHALMHHPKYKEETRKEMLRKVEERNGQQEFIHRVGPVSTGSQL